MSYEFDDDSFDDEELGEFDDKGLGYVQDKQGYEAKELFKNNLAVW